jgi:hypothetical protein
MNHKNATSALESNRNPAAGIRRPAGPRSNLWATSSAHAGASNQAIQRRLGSGIQAKLKVSQPGDRFEREADHVADTVMRMSSPVESHSLSTEAVSVQRACKECNEEVQRKPARPGSVADAGFRYPHGPGQPLPASERNFFEPRFGRDLSHVRVHSDKSAAEAADSVNARAFTIGRDVVFGAGQYQPQASAGRHLLAHELTHVIQQSEHSPGSQTPPAIQRRIGDGHDLASPWLRGDVRLEDIFDNDVTRFLRNGSRGTSVKRVQQLLFFLGFDIGVEGADGIFGPHTEAGVRAFQARFAPPVDGIIGPITIGALDVQANQPEPNRVAPIPPIPGGPPVATPIPLSVDRIDVIDSPVGAIGGYPAILGNASLNTPGPFNDPTEVKNVHQISFHLDNGNSADLTPLREVQATATLAGGRVDIPPDEVLPPGFVGPPRPGGFAGILIGNDGPGAHEIQRPTADTIVIADAPGPRGLVPANFPITFRAHFILTVSDARNAPIARINYDVIIDRRSVADVPNTENRITATARRDFVRARNL